MFTWGDYFCHQGVLENNHPTMKHHVLWVIILRKTRQKQKYTGSGLNTGSCN